MYNTAAKLLFCQETRGMSLLRYFRNEGSPRRKSSGKNVRYTRVVPVPLHFGNRKNRSLLDAAASRP